MHADCLAENVDYDKAKIIVLPGGRTGTINLAKSETVREQCIQFAKTKSVAAICAAPTILAELGLMEGKKATVHPDYEKQMRGAIVTKQKVTIDGNIITGQGLGASFDFAFNICKAIKNNDKITKIKESICY